MNARQMSLLFGGARRSRWADAEAAADLEQLRDWYARERIVMDWNREAQLHAYLGSCGSAAATSSAQRSKRRPPGRQPTPPPSARGEAASHVVSAVVAIERRAFDEASQYLRQARREVRGIDTPLVSWRIEAVTATLLEETPRSQTRPAGRGRNTSARSSDCSPSG